MRQALLSAASAAIAAVAVASTSGSAEQTPTATTASKTMRFVLAYEPGQRQREIIKRRGKAVGFFITGGGDTLISSDKCRAPYMSYDVALLPRGEIFIGKASKNCYDTEPTAAILGGTGPYRRARGEATVNYSGTINRLIIRLER